MPADIPGVIVWPLAIAVIYTVSTFGSIFGGWLPKKFIDGGMNANKARKLAMFIFALLPLSVLFASRLGPDQHLVRRGHHRHRLLGARRMVRQHLHHRLGHVSQKSGRLGHRHRRHGRRGGRHPHRPRRRICCSPTTPSLGKVEVGYGILFVVCGSAYLVAWIIMHLLVPKFKKIVL